MVKLLACCSSSGLLFSFSFRALWGLTLGGAVDLQTFSGVRGHTLRLITRCSLGLKGPMAKVMMLGCRGGSLDFLTANVGLTLCGTTVRTGSMGQSDKVKASPIFANSCPKYLR